MPRRKAAPAPFTIGPLAAWWIERNLCHGPGDVRGQPIKLNPDQRTFLDAAYRQVEDPPGSGQWRRVVRRAFYSRPKGSAKSELAGAIACFEALGPARFDGFDEAGRPQFRRVTEPLIKCLATEEGQAGNTYGNVEVMLELGPIADRVAGIDVGLTRTFLPDGGEIRPATSGAASKDGGKETFVVFDETHLYTLPEHRSMHATVRRNLPKRKTADPWALETSTMYAVGQDSIAEQTHRYAKTIAEGKIADPGLHFDHRQGPDDFDWNDDEQLRAALRQAYEGVTWVDLERLLVEAREPATDVPTFRRYFLNQPSAVADRWLAPDVVDGLLVEERLADGDAVALAFDGSEGGPGGRNGPADSTALVAIRLSDGLVEVLGLWEHDDPQHPWAPSRPDVLEAIEDAHARFKVTRAYGDPRGWETDIDTWAGRWGVWKAWPMYRRGPMTAAIERADTEISAKAIKVAADPRVALHLKAAVCDVTNVGQRAYRRLLKPSMHDKIDAAVAIVLAIEARGDALAAGETGRRRRPASFM